MTGRAALFCSPTCTNRLKGMTPDESAPILSHLYQDIARPEFTTRQRWQAGDLLMWDNHAVTHLAFNDYDGHQRLLHCTTVASERPVAFNQENT